MNRDHVTLAEVINDGLARQAREREVSGLALAAPASVKALKRGAA